MTQQVDANLMKGRNHVMRSRLKGTKTRVGVASLALTLLLPSLFVQTNSTPRFTARNIGVRNVRENVGIAQLRQHLVSSGPKSIRTR